MVLVASGIEGVGLWLFNLPCYGAYPSGKGLKK